MPELQLKYGTDQVGILTISGKSLNRDFLEKTGIAASVPVGSTEGGREFTPAILENRTSFDVELCRQDNVNAAKKPGEPAPGNQGIAAGMHQYAALCERHRKGNRPSGLFPDWLAFTSGFLRFLIMQKIPAIPAGNVLAGRYRLTFTGETKLFRVNDCSACRIEKYGN